MKHLSLVFTLALASFSVGANELPKTHFKVIGGGSHNYTYNAVEKPFWEETIKENSKGQITADLTGLAESGLKGPELVRLIRSGAVDVGMGVFAYVSSDDALLEGVDLPGMAPDIETARKIAQSYRPILDKRMSDRHGIKLLSTVAYTAQVFFCREPVQQLSDLKGRKIRTRGKNMADFVEALGAAPITLPFAEVVTALQTGVIDCAVTGIGSGNAAKWYEVANNLYNLPIDWSVGFYGIGLKRWQKLSPEVQAYVQAQADILEQRLWDETKRENDYALACNSGQGECQVHTPTTMQVSAPSEQEQQQVRDIALTIGNKWAKLCGKDCTNDWNQTAGQVINIQLD